VGPRVSAFAGCSSAMRRHAYRKPCDLHGHLVQHPQHPQVLYYMGTYCLMHDGNQLAVFVMHDGIWCALPILVCL